ncbi:Fungal specific transcription factor domain-containing protein [Colletotrichum higginsianum IMI 349063]|uniref:Fungal specific transcription factor domain-containing protein n=2 Tax=Colletotrichum higginsianum TaxID=80884 RepID=A0A1B7Y417_COLHI|nr:Fungal specific transcription factor domain-containing protein [Colletotrichum higginsianum IMI 349063]OBR06742.1 Fungal specific transcription factor domain-containing protein [Colletotrichum higginsianum IMI 349063]TIC97930.1 putative transcriptional regulatory protein C3C7.04 [Colletotrichum higginsianum]
MDPEDGLRLQRHKQRRVADKERKRAVRACDGCRRLKEKCDGGVPCRRCTRLRRQCEFLTPTTRDEPGSETTSRPRPSHHEDSHLRQRMAYMERLLAHYTGKSTLDAETLKTLTESFEKGRAGPGVPGAGAEADVSMEPEVGADAEVQSQSSDSFKVDEITVQPLENNITHYSGEFSHWNFSMRIKQWIEQCVNDAPDGPKTQFKEYYRPEELQSSSNTVASLSSLPPRYVADFLVHAFFNHAETSYFYVERHWLNDKLDLVYDNSTSLTRRDVGTVCMILIIFAIGTQYAYLDSRDERGGPPNAAAVDTSPFSEDTIGIMFYQQACRLVPDVITISSLESVQACLLIGLYTLPLDASGLSYVYLNLAVKLAIQNGMHRKYPGDGIDPVIRETRNRVWWTAYTTEKRIGIFHGRPISIAASDVDAELPVDRPDIWPGPAPPNTAHMLATLRLNNALSRIAHQISLFKTYEKQEIPEGMAKLVEMKTQLHNWWNSLPEPTFCKDPATGPAVFRPTMHLRLEYCLVRMFAGRPFIFPRDSARSTASSSGSPADSAVPPRSSGSTSKTHPRSVLVADCVDAALCVIETCRLLRNSVGLARASYTEFSSCRAALLVIITQCLQKKTDRLRDALREGMAMLREMSAGGESAKSEMSLIEAFERAISRLDTADEAVSAKESDYARFKKWEMLWKTDTPAQDARSERGLDAALPIPPHPAGLWRGHHGHGGHVAPGAGRQGTASLPPAMPFFGLDGSLSPMPPALDQFSAMFENGYVPGFEGMAGGVDGNWMGL